jgi:hypothetical protein
MIEKVHVGERVERLNFPISRVSVNKKEPQDCDYLGYKKDDFTKHCDLPTLLVAHSVAPQKTTHPKYKTNDRKLPRKNKWYTNVL